MANGMPINSSLVKDRKPPARNDHQDVKPELIPAQFAGLAEESVSAPAEEVFRTKLVWHAIAWSCVIVCLGIVAIAVSHVINPPRGRTPQAGAYGVMVLFSIAVLVSGYVAFRLAGQKYEVYADRFVAWEYFKPTNLRWDQIREVFQLMHPGWIKYRITTRLGSEFTVSSETQNYRRLGELISEQVAALSLPAALAELEAGRDVRFGPIRVTQAGVLLNGELEPWHRIGVLTFGMNPNPVKGTSMVSNMVHVRIGSAWVEMGEIPNFRLFQELARVLFPACVSV